MQAGQAITFIISADGNTTRFLVGDLGNSFTKDGDIIRRASHVEPSSLPLRILFHALRFVFGETGKVADFTRAWLVLWRVNLSPVDGPILPRVWYDRSVAIKAEIQWLEENFL